MLSLYTIRASAVAAPAAVAAAAAATRVFAVHSKPVPDEQSRTCVCVCMRGACVRAERENGREMKVDEDITSAAPRGQKGCLICLTRAPCTCHPDTEMDERTKCGHPPSAVPRPSRGRYRLLVYSLAYVVSLLQHCQIAHTELIMHNANTTLTLM